MPKLEAYFSFGTFYRVVCITDKSKEKHINQFSYGFLKIPRELISLVDFFLGSKKLKTEIPEFGKSLDAPWCEEGARLMHYHYASLGIEGEIIEHSMVPFRYYLDKIKRMEIPEIPELKRANELIIPIFIDKRLLFSFREMDIVIKDGYAIEYVIDKKGKVKKPRTLV